MCCCLIDCVGHFQRRNQALFIGIMDSIVWITIACITFAKRYQNDLEKVKKTFEIFHDKETAVRLYEDYVKHHDTAISWEGSMLGLLFILDILLMSSSYFVCLLVFLKRKYFFGSLNRRPFIPPVWIIGTIMIGIVRVITLIYFWDVLKYLVWVQFYWILSIAWIQMMVGYFKELMEENNPKLELHLPYVRAVGSDRIIDDNIPELPEDPHDQRPEYFVLGYTNDLNVNRYMNKWEGVDYFGKIHHFINERSYYHS